MGCRDDFKKIKIVLVEIPKRLAVCGLILTNNNSSKITASMRTPGQVFLCHFKQGFLYSASMPVLHFFFFIRIMFGFTFGGVGGERSNLVILAASLSQSPWLC